MRPYIAVYVSDTRTLRSVAGYAPSLDNAEQQEQARMEAEEIAESRFLGVRWD